MADWQLVKDGIAAEVKGPVATVRIDRPEFKNGLDWRAMAALCEVYEYIAGDPDARVLVVTGTGDHFYTGGRVDAASDEDRELYAQYIARSGAARDLVKLPMIAAINGDCLKGGMSWLLESDLAVAKRTVKFGYPEVRMGGVPMLVMAASMELPKKLALEAYYSSETFDAETAYRLGFLNAVTGEEDFWPTVEKYIRIVVDNPRELIQMTHDAYYAMAEIPNTSERIAFAQKMLEEKVLPQMTREKQEYNV